MILQVYAKPGCKGMDIVGTKFNQNQVILGNKIRGEP